MPELTEAGIPVAEFPLRGLKSPGSIYRTGRAFLSYVRQHRIQLVHTYDGPTSMFLIPLARTSNLPVRISSQLSLRELNTDREQRLLSVSDLFVDRVVVNSKAVLEDLVQNHGLPRSKLVLLYNGIDGRVFRPGPKFVPPELVDASVVVGSIAALREEKQLHILIEAFARVKDTRPGLRLLMVGSGSEEERLRQTAGNLGIMNQVVWIPAQADVVQWMRAIDIFVLPSRSESFPNALLEAMASGCCPVGSNVGGIPELILNEKSGLLFPSGDVDVLAERLRRLVNNDGLRTSLAAAAVERSHSQFTLERFVASTSHLYSGLLSQHYGTSTAPVTVHS